MISDSYKSIKSNEQSENCRSRGTYHYKRQEWLEALKWYNQSISYAENQSVQLALGYANRSAVYVHLKWYKEALVSINLARTVGKYSHRVHTKLAFRENLCKSLVEEQTDIAAVEPKLTYAPNAKIPYIVECLELRRSTQYGRHIVTNRDLAVGDVIAIERPFCVVIATHNQYTRCENCGADNSFNLIPCDGCAAVMYCGPVCREQAIARYHRLECPVIDYLKLKHPMAAAILPLRTTICALNLFATDTKTLHRYVKMANRSSHDTTVFDINHEHGPSAIDIFAPVHCMVTVDEPKVSQDQINDKYADLMVVLRTGYVSVRSFDRCARHLKECMLRAMTKRMPATRIHSVRDLMEANAVAAAGRQYTDYTVGVYPFRYLLNHSCVPNVKTVAYGNQQVIVVSRPIRAGDQIFECYGTPYHLYPKVHRHQLLSTFECTCDACTNEYPMWAKLSWNSESMRANTSRKFALDLNTRQQAKEFLDIHTFYLQTNDHHQPSQNLVFMNEAYGRCLMLLHEKEHFAHLIHKRRIQSNK